MRWRWSRQSHRPRTQSGRCNSPILECEPKMSFQLRAALPDATVRMLSQPAGSKTKKKFGSSTYYNLCSVPPQEHGIRFATSTRTSPSVKAQNDLRMKNHFAYPSPLTPGIMFFPLNQNHACASFPFIEPCPASQTPRSL
jgi:hypothetical protein